MLPEPMMLMVVMTFVPSLGMDQLVVGVLLACWAGVSKVRRRPGLGLRARLDARHQPAPTRVPVGAARR
jgi:hypothetical protein